MTTEGFNPSGYTALIDSDWLVYRCGFASEEDSVEQAKARVSELLTDIVYFRLGCDDYEAYLTGKSNFRNWVAATQPYKGNRKELQRPKHYEALREHLVRLGAVVTEGCEADDVVAIKMTEKPSSYILVGVDKDLLQIPGWHYNPVKDTIQYIEQDEADKHFWLQMLTGDRVDHIPGLYGIGPKKAEKILKDCVDYASMEAAVWQAYQDKGHGIDYFTEQGRLLWLQRQSGEMWTPAGSTQTKPLKDVSDDNSVQSKQD
jgi:hypothetical protein